MRKHANTAMAKPVATVRTLEIAHRQRAEFLTISCQKGLHIVPFEEILRVQAEGNYCTLHLLEGTRILCCKTLKTLGKLLPPGMFVRTHQSHLVRTDLIRFLDPQMVTMKDGTRIPLARSQRTQVWSLYTSPDKPLRMQ